MKPILLWILVLAALAVPKPAQAACGTTWNLGVGAETSGAAEQAMAFLPTEIWISPGDCITWTTGSHESHTVTLLRPNQLRPSAAQGCAFIPVPLLEDEAEVPADTPTATGEPIATPSPSAYDGVGTGVNLACVNSGSLALFTPGNTPAPPPTSYTVSFPVAGNFNFVCLIHKDMTGTIHVVNGALPHPDPQFYVDEGASEAKAILSDADRHVPTSQAGAQPWGVGGVYKVLTFGEVVAEGGGRQYLTIMRYLPSTLHVPVGATVEWTNVDPTEPHTVTFDENARFPAQGTDPCSSGAGCVSAPTDPDNDNDAHGALPNGPVLPCGVGDVVAVQNCFNAGFIGAAVQHQTGLPQPNPPRTHVFVTFNAAGTYNYYCTIHDELGMEGAVIVGDEGK